MRIRRSSSFWPGELGKMIDQFKTGDVVAFLGSNSATFHGTVLDVNAAINKVLVAWNGGGVEQHDPDEVTLHPAYAARVASRRSSGETLITENSEEAEKDENFVGDAKVHGLDKPIGGGFNIMQDLTKKLHKESIRDASSLIGRRAMYWTGPDRTFRMTKKEQESGDACCPTCKSHMEKESFTRDENLYRCSECSFKVPSSKIVTRRVEKPVEPVEVFPQSPLRSVRDYVGSDDLRTRRGKNKSARLQKRHEKILQKYLKATRNPVMDYDDLPQDVLHDLNAGGFRETLWSDVNRWLADNIQIDYRASETIAKKEVPDVDKLIASRRVVAVKSATVAMWRLILVGRLTQYDQREIKKEEKRGYVPNIYRLSLLFDSVDNVFKAFDKYENSDDPAIIKQLRDKIDRNFSIRPINGKFIKEMDEYIDSGKLPKYAAAKKEVPEAFKKQWKKNDKGKKDDSDDKGGKKKDDGKMPKELLEKFKKKKKSSAKTIAKKKGEVPEAFKKQWKNKDKDGDGKENEPKPDFVKEIEKNKKNKKKKKSAQSGKFHRDGKDIYVDSAFLNSTRGILPGSSMEHMGFGEFYLDTPNGRVDFDRMRGKDFEGQTGRSHKITDDVGGKLAKQLIRGMQNKGVAVEV